MPLRIIIFGFIAFCVAAARPARAADAGGGGSDDVVDAGCGDAGADDAGVCCDQGGVCGAPDASADAASIVVACDGALCDTLQGRPTCSVAGGSVGWGPIDRTVVAGASIALVAVIARRCRRGARRPGSGG